jgi:hypothetical protein
VRNLKIIPSFSIRKALIAKKSFRLFVEVIGSIFALCALVLLILLGRLSMGPINLDFLTPELEAALKIPGPELKTSVAHTQLVWREWRRPFEIELVDVHFQKGEKPDWLKIEHIGVSLRFYRLLQGEISLKHMRLYHPHILLERDKKGKFSFGFGENNIDQEFSLSELAPLLALGHPTPALGKLNDLQKISIVDAHITLKGDEEGEIWELPKATFVLKREREGFQTALTFSPAQGSGFLQVKLIHKLGTPRLDVVVDFDQISFKSLIKEERPLLHSLPTENIGPDDILDLFQHWDVPLDGQFKFAFDPSTFQIIEGEGDIDFGKGELDLSPAHLRPLPLESGNLSLTFSPQAIDLKNLSLLTEGMLLKMTGKLTSPHSFLKITNLMEPGHTLACEGSVNDLFFDHLAALWPQTLAPLAREWITENLRTGTLTDTTFSLKGHGEEKGFIIDDLQGTFLAEDVEITYLKELPPIQHVKVSASFDKKGFDIKVLSGNTKDFHVQEGNVLISGLDTDKEALHLDLKGKGPLSDILYVINQKPLEYPSQAGIDPNKVEGEGNLTLHMDFPLLADLRFKDVKMTLKGALKNVALEREITEKLKANLTQGALSVDLTEEQMVIQGKGILNEHSSDLRYTHYFSSEKPYEFQLQADTMASFQDFQRFGFDCGDYAKGPTKTTLIYTYENKEKNYLTINLDITPATLTIPPLEWIKKPGEPASLSFDLNFKEGKLSHITDIKMLSPLYSFQGDIQFDTQQSWKVIHFSQFKGPYTETEFSLHKPRENAYELSFQGKSVNLENFLHFIEKEENESDYTPTDIKLFVKVDHLRLGEGRVFNNVEATSDFFLQGKDSFWKEVKLRAEAGQGMAEKGDVAHISGGILFEIKPGPNDTQSLLVNANDAGQFLRNLNIYDDINGGDLDIKAERQNHGPFRGVFKLKQFDAHKVPVLARFAAVLSPVGIVNLFSDNESVSMERFDCDFVFDEAFISVKNGIGKSLSLGFTVEGKIDRLGRAFNLKGNLTPARFLNSVLNNIPVVGALLNGGEGEGLFGMSYTVTGSFDKPEVSANPLTMLTPGFLRKIFSPDGE